MDDAVRVPDRLRPVGSVVLELGTVLPGIDEGRLVSVSVEFIPGLVVQTIDHRNQPSQSIVGETSDSTRVGHCRYPAHLVVHVTGSATEWISLRDDVAKRVVGKPE